MVENDDTGVAIVVVSRDFQHSVVEISFLDQRVAKRRFLYGGIGEPMMEFFLDQDGNLMENAEESQPPSYADDGRRVSMTVVGVHGELVDVIRDQEPRNERVQPAITWRSR